MRGTVCRRIEIQNFRNIDRAQVSFSEEVNLLYGHNAQGKTNLLEAVYFTALGKSFRPVKESELVRIGEGEALLVNHFRDQLRDQALSFRLFGGREKRIVEQNGVRLGKMSEMVGAFRVVLFCPEHLSLIQGGPELRRGYLNVALSQLRPLYLQSLQRYGRILKERNALLKRAPEDMATFRATEPLWSAQLAREAAIITLHRARYIRQINHYVRLCFGEMMQAYEGREEQPELVYQSTLGGDLFDTSGEDGLRESQISMLEARYLELLSGRHDREIGAGTTLWGIHRDDIRISLNGRPARLYASQGQQRSLVLAMKLAEGWVCAKESAGDMPVFLFDDVLSELDVYRRDYLVQRLKGRQVIMTACDPEVARFDKGVHLIHVEGGGYTQKEVGYVPAYR